jgi:NAD(P)H-dependent flavin oxidoreductase YrpB (nitropropane dioxygenase family)
VAAAVSRAGGLGVLGCVRFNQGEIIAELVSGFEAATRRLDDIAGT